MMASLSDPLPPNPFEELLATFSSVEPSVWSNYLLSCPKVTWTDNHISSSDGHCEADSEPRRHHAVNLAKTLEVDI